MVRFQISTLISYFFLKQVEHGRSLSVNDLTLKSMHEDLGFKSIFIGIGNPQAKTIPIFEGLTEEQGYYTSKSFLPKVKQI